MQDPSISQPTTATRGKSQRLYYLDWLRIMATLGVFLFHVSNTFNGTNAEISNAESSDLVLIIQTFFYPWGMPLFFLLSGVGSYFALRKRTTIQFTRERTMRLLVPFFVGTILLGPVQLYFSWRHKTETGVFDGSLLDFASVRLGYPFPKVIGAVGYHMWFLGFLFLFSLLAIPIFAWFKGDSGQRFIGRLAGICEHRGAILLFILPLAVVRLVLQPFFPQIQDWADFFVYWMFFLLGYLFIADERFTRAVRRDWGILLGVGIAAFMAGTAISLLYGSFGLEDPPRTSWDFLMWLIISVCAWCWTAFMLFIGMRYMDRDSRTLRYGQDTLLPFFVLHQAVILVIAYYVVQWQASILVKFLVIALGAFAVSLGITEFIIKRVPFLRTLFGMKAGPPRKSQIDQSSTTPAA